MKHLPITFALFAFTAVGCSKKETAPEGAASPAANAGAPAAPAAALAPSGALAGFEGEVDLLVKSARDAKPIPPMKLAVKGARFRFDVPAGLDHDPGLGASPHVVVDVPKKKLFAVVDERRMAIAIDLDKVAEQGRILPGVAMAGQTPQGPPPTVTKTGKVDTVAGYRCEEWEAVSARSERTRVCVSSEEASWLSFPSSALPGEHAWAKELFDGRHLPLRFVSFAASGTEDQRIQITKIEKKPLADSLFEVPPGYQLVDMAQMAALMTGAMPAGLPTGMPPGMNLPPGMGMPPGAQLPPGAAEVMKRLRERAQAGGATPAK